MIKLLAVSLAASASALLPGAAPARADYPPGTATVTLFQTTLAARGAAVDVNFGVTCPAGATGFTSVTITRTHDGLIATGTAIAPLTCLDGGQLMLQRVTATIGGAPFTKGNATLTLRVAGCDTVDCFTTSLDQNIKITKF